MDEMPSSEFRRRYATLTEPTIVTAGSRPIGVWTPADYRWKVAVKNTVTVRDVQRDVRTTEELPSLTDRFNSRPFTPVPKKGR